MSSNGEAFRLSQEELQRVAVISSRIQGNLACARAAEPVALSPRHIKRLKSRYRQGIKLLQAIRGEARALTPDFRIFVVQPGVSKAEISDEQREMLASTELYLHETRGIEFRLVASQ